MGGPDRRRWWAQALGTHTQGTIIAEFLGLLSLGWHHCHPDHSWWSEERITHSSRSMSLQFSLLSRENYQLLSFSRTPELNLSGLSHMNSQEQSSLELLETRPRWAYVLRKSKGKVTRGNRTGSPRRACKVIDTRQRLSPRSNNLSHRDQCIAEDSFMDIPTPFLPVCSLSLRGYENFYHVS